MASLKFGRGLFSTRKPPRDSRKSVVQRFAEDTYRKSGGATPALRQVYAAYVENQKKPKAKDD